MADEPQIEEPNSNPATPTGEPAATASTTSTTDPQAPNSDNPQGDPAGTDLDDQSLIPDADGGADPAGDGDGEGDDDPAAAAANEFHGAPAEDEAYEIELPDGMTLDPVALEAVTPLARELNLSNKGLSHLAATAYPIVERQVQQAQVGLVVAQRKEWETATRSAISGDNADPVFGGENLDAVVATAGKAIDRFFGDAEYPNAKFNAETGEMEPGTFRDWLKTTGLGLHPAMVRGLYVIGSKISEDNSLPTTGAVPEVKKTREQRYYPHHEQNQ